MLGSLKPKGVQSKEAHLAYKRAHCSTCKQLQTSSLWAPVALSREATWLTLFGVTLLNQELEVGSARCSAMPLLTREVTLAPTWLLELSSSLSIVSSYALLHDHQRDNEHRLLSMIIQPAVQPHLSKALDCLGVNAELLEQMSEPADPSNLEGYLRAHHSSIATLWEQSLWLASKQSLPTLDLKHLSRLLSDIMLLKDAIDDLTSDAKQNKANPLLSLPGALTTQRREGEWLLAQRSRLARVELLRLTQHVSASTSLHAREALLNALPQPQPLTSTSPNTHDTHDTHDPHYATR